MAELTHNQNPTAALPKPAEPTSSSTRDVEVSSSTRPLTTPTSSPSREFLRALDSDSRAVFQGEKSLEYKPGESTAVARRRYGSAGLAVKNVQAMLSEIGIDSGPLDGLHGKLTTAGVRQFQERYGEQYQLTASGHVDQATMKALLSEYEKQTGRSELPISKSDYSTNAPQSFVLRTMDRAKAFVESSLSATDRAIFGDSIVTETYSYRPEQIREHSHYFEPLNTSAGRLSGNSRNWGDASAEVQVALIKKIIHGLHAAGRSSDDIAFALAVARVESGFNPDAASFHSATGPFQAIDATRESLGIRINTPADRSLTAAEREAAKTEAGSKKFDADYNIALFNESLDEMYRSAEQRANRSNRNEFFTQAYAYHHDGPSLQYGGAQLARTKVVPYIEKYKKVVEAELGRGDAAT